MVSKKTVEELRESGHAVVVFTPEEAKDVWLEDLEDHMIEKGWDFIFATSEEYKKELRGKHGASVNNNQRK